MRVNLISNDNGVGLSKDMQILESVLEGHEVERVHYTATAPHADVNIFLELLDRGHNLKHAKRNIFIPNLEWCSPRWMPLIRKTQVWCKTLDAVDEFRRQGINADFIGFTSVDYQLPNVEKKRQFLHVYGKSKMKGTAAILEAWKAMPDNAILYLVGDGSFKSDLPNVIHNKERLTDYQLQWMMNESIFHLCTSEAEGWGHYLHESKSCGAVILTTDAQPMNQALERKDAYFVTPSRKEKHHMGILHKVESGAVLAKIREMQLLTLPEANAIGAQVRKDYEARDHVFRAHLRAKFSMI